MESKVRCLYELVLAKHISINHFYRKWKSEFDGPNHFDYFLRDIKNVVVGINKKHLNKPTSLEEVGRFVEKNIGFGR